MDWVFCKCTFFNVFTTNITAFLNTGLKKLYLGINSDYKKKMITWEDFEKIDIRTGTIIEVKDFEKARKPAYQLTIDFSELGIKKSSAQIVTLHTKEELIGKQIVAVMNFPPKQIANFISECLVLGVHTSDKDVTLLTTETKINNGLKIS